MLNRLAWCGAVVLLLSAVACADVEAVRDAVDDDRGIIDEANAANDRFEEAIVAYTNHGQQETLPDHASATEAIRLLGETRSAFEVWSALVDEGAREHPDHPQMPLISNYRDVVGEWIATEEDLWDDASPCLDLVEPNAVADCLATMIYDHRDEAEAANAALRRAHAELEERGGRFVDE